MTSTARTRGHLVVVDGFRGVVTATFPSAVYVAPTRGDLLVVHDARHGPTPTSLLVDSGTTLRVAPGAAVFGRAHHLLVGDTVLDVRTAQVWSPPTAPRSGVSAAPARPSDAHVDVDLVEALVDALRPSPDAVRVQDALGRLVGRGIGLTPSGDDAIVGILAMLHRCAPPTVAAGPLDTLSGALTPMLDRTTVISAHFLRLALRGEFGERLVSVVDACCTPSGPDPAAVDRLLATGATSGADALAGVAVAADLFRVEPAGVLQPANAFGPASAFGEVA
jgi:hypothetical protein